MASGHPGHRVDQETELRQLRGPSGQQASSNQGGPSARTIASCRKQTGFFPPVLPGHEKSSRYPVQFKDARDGRIRVSGNSAAFFLRPIWSGQCCSSSTIWRAFNANGQAAAVGGAGVACAVGAVFKQRPDGFRVLSARGGRHGKFLPLAIRAWAGFQQRSGATIWDTHFLLHAAARQPVQLVGAPKPLGCGGHQRAHRERWSFILALRRGQGLRHRRPRPKSR